jgi:hypothetical protein
MEHPTKHRPGGPGRRSRQPASARRRRQGQGILAHLPPELVEMVYHYSQEPKAERNKPYELSLRAKANSLYQKYLNEFKNELWLDQPEAEEMARGEMVREGHESEVEEDVRYKKTKKKHKKQALRSAAIGRLQVAKAVT